MHSQQEVANTIKEVAKQKKIPLKTMLSECGLGVNLISQLANGQAVTYVNIAKIADYLDVSIDYLLGRSQATCSSEDERYLLEAYRSKSEEIRKATRALLGIPESSAETTKFPPFTGRLVAADGTNIGEAVPNTKKPKIRTT